MPRTPKPTPTPSTRSAQLTPSSAWAAAAAGELYRLPGSGHVARLRRPALIALASKIGHIPNPLAAEVIRLLATTEPTDTPEQQIAAFEKNAPAFVRVAQAAFVEPRMVTDRDPDYEAGEIGPQDITDTDYLWIYYSLAEGGAADVAMFRVTDQPTRG